MVTVRKARVDDLPTMLEQAKEFYEYHPLPIKYDAAHTAGIILDMIEGGVTFVAISASSTVSGPTHVTGPVRLWKER